MHYLFYLEHMSVQLSKLILNTLPLVNDMISFSE